MVPKNKIFRRNTVASIACLHNFFRHALLSRSEILTYLLLGSQLWIFLSTENSRSPGTAIDHEVSKLCHNSRKKLHIQVCHAVLKLTSCKTASSRQFCLYRNPHHQKQPSSISVCVQCLVFSKRREIFVTDRLTE